MGDNDKVLFDHATTVMAASVIHNGVGYHALFRIFNPQGYNDVSIDATEATELIEVLQTVVAKAAEERLREKEAPPQAGPFPGFGTGGTVSRNIPTIVSGVAGGGGLISGGSGGSR